MTVFRIPRSDGGPWHWRWRLRLCLKKPLAVLLFYWLTMTVASHLPIDFSRVNGLDKVLHCTAFAGLTFLAGRMSLRSAGTAWSLVAVFLAAGVYATADELSQLLVPLRVCDVHDWLADVCGAGMGVIVAGTLRVPSARGGTGSASVV
jgi:VanZ family protein